LEEFFDDRMRASSESLYSEAVVLLERDLLTHVLNHTGGNQAQTARILGISRLTLRSKIRSHGLVIERVTGNKVTDEVGGGPSLPCCG
jgi:two-component system nitrogen regulation response regulator GlnG